MKTVRKCIAFVLVLTVMTCLFMFGSIIAQAEGTTNEEVAKPANWPKRDVTITVGFAAGGDVDLNARLLAKYLTPLFGTNVVAIIDVVESEPDGYNILFSHNGGLATEAYGGSPVSLFDDMETGSGIMIDNTYVLVVSSTRGLNNYDEFVKFAKENPGELVISANANTNAYNICRCIEEGAGIELKKVEGGASITDRIVSCLAGDIDLITGAYNQFADYIENGDMVLIGSLSEVRAISHPEIPTLGEQGCPMVSLYDYGFRFPKGTPQEIMDYVDYCVKQVCEDPEFVEELTALGPNVAYRTPADWLKVCEETYAGIVTRG